eukprot:132463_1
MAKGACARVGGLAAPPRHPEVRDHGHSLRAVELLENAAVVERLDGGGGHVGHGSRGRCLPVRVDHSSSTNTIGDLFVPRLAVMADAVAESLLLAERTSVV